MASSDFERDVLLLAFRDQALLAKYSERLDPLFFQNQVYGNLWVLMCRLFTEYRQAPSYTALQAEILKDLNAEGISLFEKEDIPTVAPLLAKMKADDYIMDRWVRDQIDQWIATRAYTVATLKAEQALLKHDPDAVPGIMRQAVVAATPKSEETRDFVDRMQELAVGMGEDRFRIMKTGIVPLDECLSGGLRQAEFGLVWGVESVGKSFLTTHIGANIAVNGEDRVLHITNEMTREMQERRYLTWYTNVPRQDLWVESGNINPQRYAYLRGNLVVRYLSPGETVNSIWAILEEARLENKPFKLVIIDYIDQMAPAQKVEAKQYLQLQQICMELSALAKKQEEGGQDVCVLGVTHADSSAYDRKWGSAGMMGGSKVGKNKTLDFSLFMGQDTDSVQKGLVHVTIMKVRHIDGQGSHCTLQKDFDVARFVRTSAAAVIMETPSLKGAEGTK